MLCSLVGFALLKQNGLLNPEVNELVQLLVMYPFCVWGSVASDLDHEWDSAPTKGYPDFVINKALHITKPLANFFEKTTSKKNFFYRFFKWLNADHRSWQTHSDLTLGLCLYALYRLLVIPEPSINVTILSLVVTGLLTGIVAHLGLDLLTPGGIKLFLLDAINSLFGTHLPAKLHLVPNSSFFATGGKWENIICIVLKIMTGVMFLYVLYLMLSIYLPFKLSFGG